MTEQPNTKKRKIENEKAEIVDKIQKFDDSQLSINVLKVLKQIVDAKKVPIHLCGSCNEMDFDGSIFTELPTSKWGHEMYFCENCVHYCNQCAEKYCDDMDYMHRECKGNSSESEEGEEEEEEEKEDEKDEKAEKEEGK